MALFQPAEEVGDGARAMVDDRLGELLPEGRCRASPSTCCPAAAGAVGTRSGPVLSAADSMRITVHGRGGHGSMPQATVDPAVLAALIVVRLQTVISRETAPRRPRSSPSAASPPGPRAMSSQICGTSAQRAGRTATRPAPRCLDAIDRIVVAECQASRSPKDPEFELFEQFPSPTTTLTSLHGSRPPSPRYFGDRGTAMPMQTASEDFSDIPTALGVPYTYWGFGGIDPTPTRSRAGRASAQDIPVNHSATFAPVLQPTLDTGTEALVVAALAWL